MWLMLGLHPRQDDFERLFSGVALGSSEDEDPTAAATTAVAVPMRGRYRALRFADRLLSSDAVKRSPAAADQLRTLRADAAASSSSSISSSAERDWEGEVSEAAVPALAAMVAAMAEWEAALLATPR